jgi:hypothetical protein
VSCRTSGRPRPESARWWHAAVGRIVSEPIIRTRKEAWRVESPRAVKDEFADVAPAVNKLGFGRVRQYLDRVAGVSGSDG